LRLVLINQNTKIKKPIKAAPIAKQAAKKTTGRHPMSLQGIILSNIKRLIIKQNPAAKMTSTKQNKILTINLKFISIYQADANIVATHLKG
jgi:hypothetical protein